MKNYSNIIVLSKLITKNKVIFELKQMFQLSENVMLDDSILKFDYTRYTPQSILSASRGNDKFSVDLPKNIQ